MNILNSNYGWAMLFVVMLIMAVMATPLAKKLGILLGIMDKPNARKVHISPIPRTGGMMVYFIISLAIMLIPAVLDIDVTKEFLGWSICLIAIFVLGIADDAMDLNSKLKFVVQFIIAVGFVLMVGTPDSIAIPFLGLIEGPIVVMALFYLVWIVGVTNAVNLIDGLDGMASGVSVLSATGMLIVAYRVGDVESAILLVGLIAGLLGFLFFNIKPASVFLGDGGSLLIGFVLATVSVRLMAVEQSLSILMFVFILFIPIFDTIWSIVRRKINKKKIFEADRGHLHHRLIDKFGYWKTLIIIYSVTLGIVLAAVGLNLKEGTTLSLILGIIAIIGFVLASLKSGYFKVIGGK